MKKVAQLYNDYFDLYEKNYNSRSLKNEEKKGRDYKQFEIIGDGYQEPESSNKKENKTKKP